MRKILRTVWLLLKYSAWRMKTFLIWTIFFTKVYLAKMMEMMAFLYFSPVHRLFLMLCKSRVSGLHKPSHTRTFLLHKEIPPKVEYTLTELGKSFIPVLNQMMAWSEIHLYPPVYTSPYFGKKLPNWLFQLGLIWYISYRRRRYQFLTICFLLSLLWIETISWPYYYKQ